MKKWITVLALSGFILTSCGAEEESEEPIEEPTEPEQPTEPEEPNNGEDASEISQNPADYFPIEADTHYHFGGYDGTMDLYPQFIEENVIQMTQYQENIHTTIIYEVTDELIAETFVRTDTPFRDNFIETGVDGNQDNYTILLEAPIEVGHTWESPSGEISEIVEIDTPIETGLGEYEAVQVRGGTVDGPVNSFFVENVGLVQMDLENQQYVLEAVNENVPEPNHTIPVYTYQVQTEENEIDRQAMIRNEIEAELYTNDPIRFAMMDILSQDLEELPGVRPTMDEGEINFMYMTNEGIPHIDFTDPITRDYVGGSSSEHLHNYLLIDMTADYYGTEDVIFTVEGEPWSGSHLQFDDERAIAFEIEAYEAQEFIDIYGEE